MNTKIFTRKVGKGYANRQKTFWGRGRAGFKGYANRQKTFWGRGRAGFKRTLRGQGGAITSRLGNYGGR